MRLVACILALWAPSVFGAVYYVDYASGSDSNAGTSTGAPFQHCPGDSRATGSASFTPSIGDTIVFHAGVTYTMDATALVTLGQHSVTYVGGQHYSTPWGSGWPVIDCTANDPSLSGVNGSWNCDSKTNVVVDGLHFTGGAYIDSYNGLVAYRNTGGSWADFTVRRCKFSEATESGVFIWGSWDAGTGAQQFTIQSNQFLNLGTHGVFLRYGLSNVMVLDNAFTNIGWRTDSPGPGGDPVGVFGHDSPSWNYGLTVRGNVSYGVPIKSFVILSDQNWDAVIERNHIGGTNGYAGLDINGNGTNIAVRNNVFDLKVANFYGPVTVDTDQGSGTMVDGLSVLNNTVRAETANIGLVFLGKGNSGSSSTSMRVGISNNILISATSSRSMVYIESSATGDPASELAAFGCDYNVFETNGYATAFHLDGVNYSLSGWQALGYDAHSYGGTPVFGTGWELDSADTLALDNGADLSGLFDDDYSGATRNVPWDIGAYDAVAGVGVTATANSASVGTLNGP